MAIAVDNTIVNSAGSGTSTTVSFTVSGDNRLIMSGGQDQISGSTFITGITYNGVSLTLINGLQRPSERYTTLWYLLNPSTGTNNYTITKSSSGYHGHWGVSYTGVKNQAPTANSTNSQGTLTTSYSHSLTTIGSANKRIMGTVTESVGASPSTDTIADTALLNGFTFFAYDGVATAGTYTQNYTTGSSTRWASVMASFEEEPVASTFTPRVMVY